MKGSSFAVTVPGSPEMRTTLSAIIAVRRLISVSLERRSIVSHSITEATSNRLRMPCGLPILKPVLDEHEGTSHGQCAQHRLKILLY